MRIISGITMYRSAEVICKVPLKFLEKAYYGLHDLELDLAVKKVGAAS